MVAYERVREAQLAAAWAAGAWRGQVVHAEDGASYLVHFEGRRGGGAGPDFRDAVLVRGDGARVMGDIELHLRPQGWVAHGHATDPRYDGLALHVVLTAPRTTSQAGAAPPPGTPLASGRMAPLVVLGSLSPPHPTPYPPWPCRALDAVTLRHRLNEAGEARFERRVRAFATSLIDTLSGECDDETARVRAANRILWPALAEALAYGRDRAALRALGARLAAGDSAETLAVVGEALQRVERDRVRGLLALAARFGEAGPVATLAPLLDEPACPRCAQRGEYSPHLSADAWAIASGRRMGQALVVPGGAVSPGRAAIVVVNVVLPFLAAWGVVSGDDVLARHARGAYATEPGLPANTITRTMNHHLGLRQQPRGARAQQGLHEIWGATCREKRCAECLLSAPPRADTSMPKRPTGRRQKPGVAYAEPAVRVGAPHEANDVVS